MKFYVTNLRYRIFQSFQQRLRTRHTSPSTFTGPRELKTTPNGAERMTARKISPASAGRGIIQTSAGDVVRRACTCPNSHF